MSCSHRLTDFLRPLGGSDSVTQSLRRGPGDTCKAVHLSALQMSVCGHGKRPRCCALPSCSAGTRPDSCLPAFGAWEAASYPAVGLRAGHTDAARFCPQRDDGVSANTALPLYTWPWSSYFCTRVCTYTSAQTLTVQLCHLHAAASPWRPGPSIVVATIVFAFHRPPQTGALIAAGQRRPHCELGLCRAESTAA